jgi:aminoglycoside phosphotransferase (APT) family kinase protein
MPAAEVDVDEALVRALLEEQHPDLARWPLRLVANGWDNVLFRLGDELVVRLPRRELAVPLVEHEQRWLPELAPRLPLPVPVPVRVGRPGAGYPWPWTVCAWMPGESALVATPTDLGATAEALGRFLAALHVPAPADAPGNPFRGIPLADRAERTLAAVERLGDTVDGPRLRALWDELVATPLWAGPPVWVHGDTHPGNLVVHEGRLAAVVDFGDLCSGDPASDLAVAWMLFPPEHRDAFRAAAGAADDDHLWTRARAWGLALGLVLSADSADNPANAALGARTLAAVLSDPGSTPRRPAPPR